MLQDSKLKADVAFRADRQKKAREHGWRAEA
jgi:hypothetical protein